MSEELFYIYMHYFCKGCIFDMTYDDAPETIELELKKKLVDMDFRCGLSHIIDPDKIKSRGISAISLMNRIIGAQKKASKIVVEYAGVL